MQKFFTHPIFSWFKPPPDPYRRYVYDIKNREYWLEWQGLSQLYLWRQRRLVGQVDLVWEEDGAVRLEWVEVFLKSAREQGLGRAMLQEASRVMKARKAKTVWGVIPKSNVRAEGYLVLWFRRQGFTVFRLKNRLYVEKSFREDVPSLIAKKAGLPMRDRKLVEEKKYKVPYPEGW
jgi:hypothetical protein